MTPRRRQPRPAQAQPTSYVGMYAPEMFRRKLRVRLLEAGIPMRQQLQEWIAEYVGGATPAPRGPARRLRGFTKDAVQVGVPLAEGLARKFRAKLIMDGLTASEWVTRRIADTIGESVEKLEEATRRGRR